MLRAVAETRPRARRRSPHVVFTLPEEIAAIDLQNKRAAYGILFATSAATLRTIAADPKHFGAEIGFVSVLHTWTQDLRHHPHVHCVVPGGGLAPDGTWVACRPGFFLPVRLLAAMFRGKFVAGLRAAFERGELRFQGSLQHLRDRAASRSASIARCARLGRLQQAAVRWPGPGAEIPGALHPPRRHRQPAQSSTSANGA